MSIFFTKNKTPSGIGKAFKRLGFVQTFFDGIGNLICRNPEKPEQFIGRTGSAETVHSDYGTGEPDVFLPAEFGRRFYGNPRRIAKNFFLITDILAIKQLHTGH